MCGRYTITKNKKKVEKTFNATSDQEFIENYNIAPSNYLPTIINNSPKKIHLLKWGLIPSWSKDSSIGNRMINARIETIFEKPSFKQAIIKRRCCVIADGYYEWKGEKNNKQPYYIHLKDHSLYLFGGIWETWKDQDQNIINSFSIITKKAGYKLSRIHHREPVVIKKELKDDWLSTNNHKEINKIADAFDYNQFTFYAVSKSVNSVQNNHRELINSI